MLMKNMSCCALATHSSTQQYRCLLVIYFYAAAKDVGWRNNAFGWFVCMCLPLLHFYEMQEKTKSCGYLPPPGTQMLFFCRSCCAQGLNYFFM